jgi:hypothetical protein
MGTGLPVLWTSGPDHTPESRGWAGGAQTPHH